MLLYFVKTGELYCVKTIEVRIESLLSAPHHRFSQQRQPLTSQCWPVPVFPYQVQRRCSRRTLCCWPWASLGQRDRLWRSSAWTLTNAETCPRPAASTTPASRSSTPQEVFIYESLFSESRVCLFASLFPDKSLVTLGLHQHPWESCTC